MAEVRGGGGGGRQECETQPKRRGKGGGMEQWERGKTRGRGRERGRRERRKERGGKRVKKDWELEDEKVARIEGLTCDSPGVSPDTDSHQLR
eukprot:762596-Hanusia_phi.AAC.2